jgi:hypothetical protein
VTPRLARVRCSMRDTTAVDVTATSRTPRGGERIVGDVNDGDLRAFALPPMKSRLRLSSAAR